VAGAIGRVNGAAVEEPARTGMQIFFAVAAVMLTSEFILVVSGWCHAVLGFVAWLVLLLVSTHTWGANNPARITLGAGFTGFLYIALKIEQTMLRMVLLSWIFAGLYLIGARFGEKRKVPRGHSVFLALHVTTLGLAVLLVLYTSSDRIWFFLRYTMERLSTSGFTLGIWVSSLPVYLFGFLFLMFALLEPRVRLGAGGPNESPGSKAFRLSVFTIGFLILLGGFFGGLALLHIFVPVTALKVSLHQLAALILVSIVISLADRALTHEIRPEVALASLLLTGSITVLLVICWFRLLGPPDSIAWSPGLRAAESKPTNRSSVASDTQASFALYSEGLLDWNVPDSKGLGLTNSGMFGLFRRSLERYAARHGGRVVLIDQITDQSISSIAAVIFINPTRALISDETLRLKRFVTSGGGMLVLGDHTGLGGSMEPLKTVCSFTSVRFNFNSAVPLRQHWPGSLELRRHPVTRGLKDELALQLGVGASLIIEEPAFPIVVARYGFADRGDSLNTGMGAYMGNTEHEHGEPVGDLVLVAGEHIGRGRVLVFGDTSPFQNGALFLSHHFIGNAMTWLIGGDQLRDQAQGEDSGSASPHEESGKGARSGRVCILSGHASDEMRFADETALIDFSLKPAASLSLFSQSSLGGLANCLARVGVVASPALSTRDWKKQSQYLFLIAPTLRLRERELRWLADYMAQGGNVILSQGYASPQPSEPLLSYLGFSIRNINLGNGDSHASVEHKEAWPVFSGANMDTIVIARAFGYPTIVSIPFGKGSFTLIADGRFFLDENLESEKEAHRRNIAFVAQLIEGLRLRRHQSKDTS